MSEAFNVVRSACLPCPLLERVKQLARGQGESVGELLGAAVAAKVAQWSRDADAAMPTGPQGDRHAAAPGEEGCHCSVNIPSEADEMLRSLSLSWNRTKTWLIVQAVEQRLAEWSAEDGAEILSRDCKAAHVGDARRKMREFEENRRREPTLWEGVFELLAGTGMSVLLKASTDANFVFGGEALPWTHLLDMLGAEGELPGLPDAVCVERSSMTRTWMQSDTGGGWGGSGESPYLQPGHLLSCAAEATASCWPGYQRARRTATSATTAMSWSSPRHPLLHPTGCAIFCWPGDAYHFRGQGCASARGRLRLLSAAFRGEHAARNWLPSVSNPPGGSQLVP